MSHEPGDGRREWRADSSSSEGSKGSSLGQSIYLRYPVASESRLGPGATADKLTGTVTWWRNPLAVAVAAGDRALSIGAAEVTKLDGYPMRRTRS